MENRSCIPQTLTRLGQECWECSECRILVQITSTGHELVPLLVLTYYLYLLLHSGLTSVLYIYADRISSLGDIVPVLTFN